MASSASPAEKLTDRERFLIALVADGLTNKQIAVLMNTTETMVKNYMRAVFDKLGFSNRLEVALWHVHQQHCKDNGKA